MRLDQLTDGLNSTEPEVVCKTLQNFRNLIILNLAGNLNGSNTQEDQNGSNLPTSTSNGLSSILLFRQPMSTPTSLFLEFCTSSPKLEELFTIWQLGNEKVCVEIIETFALMLTIGRHDAIGQATKRIIRERIDDGVTNIINKSGSIQAIPYMKLFTAITRQGMISTSTLLSKLKVSFKSILKAISNSGKSSSNSNDGNNVSNNKQKRRFRYNNTSESLKLRFEGVRFMLGLLQCGAPDIQQEMLEHKGFVQTLITGISQDHILIVEDTLSTFEKNVLTSSRLSRSLKKRVFGAMVLRSIIKLITKNYCTNSFETSSNYSNKNKNQQYISGIVEGDANMSNRDTDNHSNSNKHNNTNTNNDNNSNARKKASLIGIDFLRTLLCGNNGKIFFSNTTNANNTKTNNIIKCSPLIHEVIHQLSPLRFDNHRKLILDILQVHPMAIEKYILQLPFSIEPASTPKWYAAVVLLKQIFEIGEFIDYVHKINFNNNQLQHQRILKIIVPVNNIKQVIGRGLLHKDSKICFASLKLLESVLNRLDKCQFIFTANNNGDHANRKKELNTKLRAILPSFSVLQSTLAKQMKNYIKNDKVAKESSSNNDDASNDTFTTVISLLECIKYYIKLFPAAASDTQFDASRFMDVINVEKVWKLCTNSILNVIHESAKNNLFHWNRFLKSNNQISPLNKILQIYICEEKSANDERKTVLQYEEERILAKKVIFQSILSVGLFSSNSSDSISGNDNIHNTYSEFLKRRELKLWLENITTSIHVQIFDKALCQIVQKPLNFLPSSTTTNTATDPKNITAIQFSSFTIAMQSLLVNYITENGPRKIPKAYVNIEEIVIRYVIDGLRSLIRVWPRPYDVFALIKLILVTDEDIEMPVYPLSTINTCLVNAVVFMDVVIKNYSLAMHLKTDKDINYDNYIAKIALITQTYKDNKASVNATVFNEFLNNIISSDVVYSSKELKKLLDWIDTSEEIENQANDTLFDLEAVATLFESDNTNDIDNEDNKLIKLLSLVPTDVLLMQLLKSKSKNLSMLNSKKHNDFIINALKMQNDGLLSDKQGDDKSMSNLSAHCIYDASRSNILNLIFKRFSYGIYDNMDFLWDLINIESMAQNATENDVYLFEVLNCFIAHLNTHKVLLSLTNNGVINIDKRQIDFIRSSCRILSKCSDQIKKLKLEIFHKTQEDIYECLRTCIEKVDNTKANGSDDSEQFLDTVETISYMCDLIESNSKLELAMLLVQKLEQATMKKRKQIIFTPFQRKILSLLITGAATNLSESQNITGTLKLFKLCTTVLCQGSGRDDDIDQHDATVLDESCLILTKCLAFVHTNVFLNYITNEVLEFLWNNCTNLIRGEILSILTSITSKFSNQIIVLLKEKVDAIKNGSSIDITHWSPYLSTILILFSKVNNDDYRNKAYSVLKSELLCNILLQVLSTTDPNILKQIKLKSVKTACSILRLFWWHCNKDMAEEGKVINNDEYSQHQILRQWSLQIQMLSSNKKACGTPLCLAFYTVLTDIINGKTEMEENFMTDDSDDTELHDGNRNSNLVSNVIYTCMGQLVVLRSRAESASLQKRTWIKCLEECIDFNNRISDSNDSESEGAGSNAKCFSNQELSQKLDTIFPAFVKACLKYGYFDKKLISILNDVILILFENRVISATNASLPIVNIFDMVIGHSKFREIVNLKDQTWIFTLIYTLAKIDMKSCLSNQRVQFVYPILLAAYGASLSNVDKAIVRFLFLPLKINPRTGDINSIDTFTFLTDVHYAYDENIKIQMSKISNSEKRTSENDDDADDGVLSSWLYHETNGLSLTKLKQTLENFPIRRTIDEMYYFDGDYDNDARNISDSVEQASLYDPLYIILTMNMELLQSKEILNVKNLFGTNVSFLHFAIFSLSSESSFVRQQSYEFISKLFSILENHVNMFSSKLDYKDPFPEGKEILTCLRSLKNSITEENEQLPGMVCAFICEGINILRRVNHCVYPLINKFLLSRPFLDLTDVPMYYTLFSSGTPTYRIERMWILKTLCFGERSQYDLKLFSRRHVYSMLIALFDSPASDHVTRPVILKIFSRVLAVKGSLNTLFRCGFISWLPILALKDHMKYLSYSIDAWFLIFEQIQDYMLFQNENDKKIEDDDDKKMDLSSNDDDSDEENDDDDFMSKIHHEDFKMLQINLDFAITNILFEIMSKIKGISNSESEGAKYKELLKKILDLSAQSAMYLKPELIMTFSYDKGMLLVDLSKNNEKNEESDFELLKLTLENICLRLSSSANQDQNNNNNNTADDTLMKLESIISWSFDTYAAMRDNYASINNNSNVSLTMFGGNMGKFLNSLPEPMLNKINYSLRCRRSASKFQHALYNSNSEADIYLDGWITSMNASEKILTEVIVPITIIDDDDEVDGGKEIMSGNNKKKRRINDDDDNNKKKNSSNSNNDDNNNNIKKKKQKTKVPAVTTRTTRSMVQKRTK